MIRVYSKFTIHETQLDQVWMHVEDCFFVQHRNHELFQTGGDDFEWHAGFQNFVFSYAENARDIADGDI